MATAYVWSAAILIIFFLIAILIATQIKDKPDHIRVVIRRFWFWVMAVITFPVSFFINYGVAEGIKDPSTHALYMNNTIVGSCAAFVLFVVAGVVVSKIFKKTKLGTWF